MSRHLIVGGDGLIGRGLRDRLLGSGEVVFTTTRQFSQCSNTNLFLDLSQDVASWLPPQPIDVAYLCAAVSSLERCRTDPVYSYSINVTGTVAIAKTFVEQGTFVIFLSSNAVYDGRLPYRRAEEPVCPTTEYGKQKAETEQQLLALGDRVSIVRFAKVLAPNNPLLNNWRRSLQNGEIIRPFSDLAIAPISLTFAIEVLQRIARCRLPGIVQVSGPCDVTYEQVARYLQEQLNANPNLVEAIAAAEAGLPLEVIPQYTTLDTTRLQTELRLITPAFGATLDSILQEGAS